MFIPAFRHERELAVELSGDAGLIRTQRTAARLQLVAFICILCPVLPRRSRLRTKQIVRGGTAASAIVDVCTQDGLIESDLNLELLLLR